MTLSFESGCEGEAFIFQPSVFRGRNGFAAEKGYFAEKPPVETVKPPVQTVKPPVQAAKPPVQAAKPPVQAAKPPIQPAKTAAASSQHVPLAEKSKKGMKKARAARNRRNKALDIERAVHFLRRVTRFIDVRGNWIGPLPARRGEPNPPGAILDRAKLAEVAQFCNDRQRQLDEIQLESKTSFDQLTKQIA